MVTLKQLAYEALEGVAIYISEHYGYSGSVFGETEYAKVRVTVTNNTGLTLRDVFCTLHVSGAAKVAPISFWGMSLFDGEASWDELEPYKSKEFVVRIKGRYSGDAYMNAGINAEVVPYSSRHRASRTIYVHPE